MLGVALLSLLLTIVFAWRVLNALRTGEIEIIMGQRSERRTPFKSYKFVRAHRPYRFWSEIIIEIVFSLMMVTLFLVTLPNLSSGR